MIIEAKDLGKRFRREWVFRNFSFNFLPNESYALIGPNGSGKSTLLQILAGYIPATTGSISYSLSPEIESKSNDGAKTLVEAEEFFQYITLSSPYLELVEEYTLTELLTFHFSFKKIKSGLTTKDLVGILYLEGNENKYVKEFSSGMKQRLKLGLAFYSEVPIIFLDEPTANLDKKGIHWYNDEVAKLVDQRIIIIASNQEHEYTFCNHSINLEHYKS